MRLPKRILINNIPFKVMKTNKSPSSGFSYRKTRIEIGTRGLSNREILGAFIHEIAEISCVERSVRSTKDKIQHENNDVVFMASHKDFTDVMCDVSSIVGDMMKLE